MYPRGTRVQSTNLNPAHVWRNGSHIAALNWQKYDRGTQFNEAMFSGTPGYVLKPPRLLPGADPDVPIRKERFMCRVIGLSSRMWSRIYLTLVTQQRTRPNSSSERGRKRYQGISGC